MNTYCDRIFQGDRGISLPVAAGAAQKKCKENQAKFQYQFV